MFTRDWALTRQWNHGVVVHVGPGLDEHDGDDAHDHDGHVLAVDQARVELEPAAGEGEGKRE